MREVLLAYKVRDETVDAIMMLYTDTRSMKKPDGDSNFFKNHWRVLQSNTFAIYLFILCLDYVLRRAIDSNKKQGFTLHITYLKFIDVDDLAVLSDHLTDAAVLLYYLEETPSEVELNANSKFLCYNRHYSRNIKSLKKWKHQSRKKALKAALLEQKET